MANFKELGVNDTLLKAIDELGFVTPMPVQEAVIPVLLGENCDIIALAQTGTGKTAAFGLPLLQRLDMEKREIQAVIMSPTRELCLQISDDLRDFGKHIEGLHITAVYGGSSIEQQIRQIKKGSQVIVATPGRLVDLIERGVADISTARTIVLDEADEMLNMGFSESINAIFEQLNDDHSTLLFSATMSKDVERVAKQYLHEYKEIVVGSRNEGAENVNHVYYLVNAKDKYLALKRVVDFYPRIYAIVFCRTKLETQEIADHLIRDGYNADSLHGDLSQQQRDLTMQKFRNHLIQLLVATDVAARGLDVDDLTHVINYGMPDDIESYTHRSGRTGRAGKKGTSIAIVHVREKHKIREVEKQIGKEFVDGTLPTPHEICTKQLFRAIDKIEKTDVDDEQIEPFMEEVRRHFEYVDKDDILKKMVSSMFGRFLDYYANAPEIIKPTTGKAANSSSKKGRNGDGRGKSGEQRGPRKAEKGFSRLFINLGKDDGFYPGEVMSFINRHVQGRQQVGHIDLLPRFSYIEVPERDARKVMAALDGTQYKGRAVRCNREDDGPKGRVQKSHDDRKRSSKPKYKDVDERDVPRGKQGWKAFVEQEEGWARRRPKKKK